MHQRKNTIIWGKCYREFRLIAKSENLTMKEDHELPISVGKNTLAFTTHLFSSLMVNKRISAISNFDRWRFVNA